MYQNITFIGGPLNGQSHAVLEKLKTFDVLENEKRLLYIKEYFPKDDFLPSTRTPFFVSSLLSDDEKNQLIERHLQSALPVSSHILSPPEVTK